MQYGLQSSIMLLVFPKDTTTFTIMENSTHLGFQKYVKSVSKGLQRIYFNVKGLNRDTYRFSNIRMPFKKLYVFIPLLQHVALIYIFDKDKLARSEVCLILQCGS